jgi:hypothetical protein
MTHIFGQFKVLLDYLKHDKLKALNGLSISTWIDAHECEQRIQQVQKTTTSNITPDKGLCTAYTGALLLGIITDIEVGFLVSKYAVPRLPLHWWSNSPDLDKYNVWKVLELRPHRNIILPYLQEQTHHPLFTFMGEPFSSLFDQHVINFILSVLESIHPLTSGYVQHWLIVCMAHLTILKWVIHDSDDKAYEELMKVVRLFTLAKTCYRSSLPARVGIFIIFSVLGDTQTAQSWYRSVQKYSNRRGVYRTYGFIL